MHEKSRLILCNSLVILSIIAQIAANNLFAIKYVFSEVLRPCKDRLGATDRTHKELVDDVVRQFKFNQRLQIMCFQ